MRSYQTAVLLAGVLFVSVIVFQAKMADTPQWVISPMAGDLLAPYPIASRSGRPSTSSRRVEVLALLADRAETTEAMLNSMVAYFDWPIVFDSVLSVILNHETMSPQVRATLAPLSIVLFAHVVDVVRSTHSHHLRRGRAGSRSVQRIRDWTGNSVTLPLVPPDDEPRARDCLDDAKGDERGEN